MAHGGAREGAGRKALPEGLKKQTIAARVSADTRAWLFDQAQYQGVSVGRIIDELVASFIEQEKEG
jgi:hypothetical protein